MTELETAPAAAAATGGAASGWRPTDSFANRLSQVRREMGWNHTTASIECGFSRQNWRKWEMEGVRPSNMAEVVEKIHARTGVDRIWLMWGDAMSSATRQYRGRYRFSAPPGEPRRSLDVCGVLPAA